MSVVNDSFDQPMRLEEKASARLAGGIMNQGYQCGMLWGAALSAGAEACRRYGTGPEAESMAIVASQRCIASFQTQTNHEINCSEISEITKLNNEDMKAVLKFALKGGPVHCFRLAGRYAPLVFNSINAAFEEGLDGIPPLPVSCTSLLATKMGVSKERAVMAAGLAGGIGLSGGACGALGTAVWISAMKQLEKDVSPMELLGSKSMEIIDQFLDSSDYEFECAAIAGRKFADVADHAAYVANGGCTHIIDTLAAQVNPD